MIAWRYSRAEPLILLAFLCSLPTPPKNILCYSNSKGFPHQNEKWPESAQIIFDMSTRIEKQKIWIGNESSVQTAFPITSV